ncbi:DNA-binding protein [uncultured Prevotella sp.]|uniref:HU family DNA-binding protein n=1 Tax=uncultured Prevotella sp. TaxID=159272 RepID=UPI0025E191EE|nr:DNA-binding protein [uncultured Prevotella sp.]
MSQKFIKSQNKNSFSQAYGKYFAQAVYDNHFIGTEELSDFIQRQASVKKSDIKAVLQELGEAFKHFFEMGQKIKLDGIGIFKVGFSSIGVTRLEDCGAQTITTRRVLFQPETTRVVVGQQKLDNGTVKQKYVNAITMLKDVVFEETHDNAMNVESDDSGNGSTNPSNGTNSGSGSNTGGNSGTSGTGGDNTGGNSGGGDNPGGGSGDDGYN